METKHGITWAATLAAVSLSGTVTETKATPWTMPAGEAEHFSYANGQDLNGIFGDPYVSGDTFVFPDFSMSVSAENGANDSQSDAVSVDLYANPGWMFGLTRITAFGSYGATGNASVDFDALISFQELGPPGRSWNGPMHTNPSFPRSNDSGSWSGLAVIDITFEFPHPSDSMHLEYSNSALAITGVDGSAYLNVLYQPRGAFELHIGMVPIPEPGSLALLLCGVVLTAGRRKGAW